MNSIKRRSIHIVGNWKMNQLGQDIIDFFKPLEGKQFSSQAWIAPQHVHIPLSLTLSDKCGGAVKIGAQNCSHQKSGAFTGDISAEALKDLDVSFTLVGHSERRAFFQETNQMINQKTIQALENGLQVIFCVGETLEEREKGETSNIIKEQLNQGLTGLKDKYDLSKVIIAYEPVWAIGTGKVATPEQAQQVHAYIRENIAPLGFDADSTIILYGGSVKPSNIDGLLECPDIDGGLVGGASLKATDFIALCESADKYNN